MEQVEEVVSWLSEQTCGHAHNYDRRNAPEELIMLPDFVSET